MYFYVRNRFHIHQVKFNSKIFALFNYCCFLVAFAGIVMIYQKTDRLKKLGFMMWPAADAFTNNFEATPALILTKLNNRSSFSLSSTINGYLKTIWSTLLTPFTPQRNGSAANA